MDDYAAAAELFQGFPEGAAILHAVQEAVSTLSETTMKATKSQVAFRRRGFAYVWRPGQYINSDVPAVLSIALPRELRSDRIKELGGLAGEPATRDGAGRQQRQGVLGGPLEHGGDLGDRHHVEVQGTGAGRFDRPVAVAADQAEEPVHRAHPRPRQRVVQEPFGVDAHVFAVAGARVDQAGQVA